MNILAACHSREGHGPLFSNNNADVIDYLDTSSNYPQAASGGNYIQYTKWEDVPNETYDLIWLTNCPIHFWNTPVPYPGIPIWKDIADNSRRILKNNGSIIAPVHHNITSPRAGIRTSRKIIENAVPIFMGSEAKRYNVSVRDRKATDTILTNPEPSPRLRMSPRESSEADKHASETLLVLELLTIIEPEEGGSRRKRKTRRRKTLRRKRPTRSRL